MYSTLNQSINQLNFIRVLLSLHHTVRYNHSLTLLYYLTSAFRSVHTKTTKKNQHIYDKKTTFCIVLVIQTIYLDRFWQYSTVSLIYICKNIFLNFTLNLNLQFVSKRSNGNFAMCIYICITALIQIIIFKTRNRTF